MSIPSQMQAAVVEPSKVQGEPNKVVVKDVPVPKPGPHQVLIKVHTCGVCHSDAGVIAGHFGAMVQYPRIPGHEVVGSIVQLGESVNRFKIGDLVGGGWHGGHDGTCRSCQQGSFQMCDKQAINGVTQDGGWAEYCVLREEAAVPLPDGLDKAEMAPLLCAGVTVFTSIRNQNIPQGGVVGIVGLGGLGHLAVQYARKMGYKVVVLSRSPEKEDFAKKLGAHEYVHGKTSGEQVKKLEELGGIDLLVVTAPNPEIVNPLLSVVRSKGKVLVLAPSGDITVSTLPLIMKGISVGGWPSGHSLDSQDAIQFAMVQDVKCMIEKFPLAKVQEAVDKMMDNQIRFRGVLVME